MKYQVKFRSGVKMPRLYESVADGYAAVKQFTENCVLNPDGMVWSTVTRNWIAKIYPVVSCPISLLNAKEGELFSFDQEFLVYFENNTGQRLMKLDDILSMVSVIKAQKYPTSFDINDWEFSYFSTADEALEDLSAWAIPEEWVKPSSLDVGYFPYWEHLSIDEDSEDEEEENDQTD